MAPLRWATAAVAAPAARLTNGSWFSRSTYLPHVGTAFTFGSGSTGATLVLAAVRDLPPQPVKERANLADGRFSLLFTSASTLTQGTMAVHHDALGDSALFVVPIGPRSAVRNYEVVVNRLT